MRFIRMQESGRVYLGVDCMAASDPPDPASWLDEARRRHAGPVIVISRADGRADARMDMYDSDGNAVDGCGDGIRSVATYLCEQGRARESPLAIESARGLWNVEVEGRGPRAERVRIDMGTPTLAADRIPTRFPGNPPLEIPMTWPDTMHNVTCIGIGDPHAVIFVRDLTEELVQGIGPELAHHSFFPLKTNVGFVRVNRRDDVTVRVWGRAGAELPVSSSGACAVVVAGVLAGRTGRQVTVHMPGGDLDVNWASQPDEHIYLTGPGAVIADSK